MALEDQSYFLLSEVHPEDNQLRRGLANKRLVSIWNILNGSERKLMLWAVLGMGFGAPEERA